METHEKTQITVVCLLVAIGIVAILLDFNGFLPLGSKKEKSVEATQAAKIEVMDEDSVRLTVGKYRATVSIISSEEISIEWREPGRKTPKYKILNLGDVVDFEKKRLDGERKEPTK